MAGTFPATTTSATAAAEARPAPPKLFRGLRIVSLCTLLSRILGLVRDIAMAALFGAGPVMDAFSVAFRIPNLFRRLFGEGALTAAFLPLFVRETRQHGENAGWELATAVLAAVAVVLGLLTVVGELVLGTALWLAPLGPESRLLIGLTAALLPYVVLICLAAQLSAMLNALHHFAWPALVPVLMNVIWIAGLFLVVRRFQDPIDQAYAVAACILVAGLFQCLAQWPALRACGFRFQFDWQTSWLRIREIAGAMLPVVLGLVVAQVNTLADSFLAWGLAPGTDSGPTLPIPGEIRWPVSPGAASSLYFGQRLYQFPLGIFGVALSTVMFPRFAEHAEAGRLDRLRDDLLLGLRLVLVIGLPASAGLMLLADPATRLFFLHGAFDAEDLAQTAAVVVAYSTAIWAWCALLITTRAFYALGDRVTPLRFSLYAVVGNLLLNLVLVWPLGGTGLAWATSITSIVQTLFAVLVLQRRMGASHGTPMAGFAARTALATGLLYWTGHATLSLLPQSTTVVSAVVRLLVPMAAASVAYLLAAWWLGLRELWLPFQRESSGEPDSKSEDGSRR